MNIIGISLWDARVFDLFRIFSSDVSQTFFFIGFTPSQIYNEISGIDDTF